MKALLLLVSLMGSMYCQASIILNADLNFGTVIVADPSVVGTVTVSRGGGTSSSGSIHVVEKGHPAELILESFPIGVYLNISTDILDDELAHTQLISQGKLRVIQLHHPVRVFTDRYGRARLVIGGTLQSMPNAGSYLDGQYETTISVEVSY